MTIQEYGRRTTRSQDRITLPSEIRTVSGIRRTLGTVTYGLAGRVLATPGLASQTALDNSPA